MKIDKNIVTLPSGSKVKYDELVFSGKKGVNVNGRCKANNIETKSSKPKSNKKQVKRSE